MNGVTGQYKIKNKNRLNTGRGNSYFLAYIVPPRALKQFGQPFVQGSANNFLFWRAPEKSIQL